MSFQQTRRKCRCCTKFFFPDPRNQTRQHYCSQPACRQASKAASQRRWLSKPGNRDYFRGADQVLRVKLWRQSHPGYWRTKAPSSQGTQTVESQSTNLGQTSCNVPSALPGTLQDCCLAQDSAFVGLISMVTGSTLQEDIAATTRQLLLRGRNILGCVSPGKTQNANPTPDHDPETSPSARATASHSPKLQLGGSSISP
jgi:hypothetical protein